MSRRIFGWALVIGFGVVNGIMTFQPAFEAREEEKRRKEELAAMDLGPGMIEVPAEGVGPKENDTSVGTQTNG